MTDFQDMKLYEAFGESAPQAALQMAIILQIGSVSATQMFSIFTSLLSLTLGATEIMLMMKTKNKTIKEASWKETWILVFPVMFCVVVPRILCISLIMAYAKEYVLVFVILYILLNMAINYDHIQRDPGHVMLGIFTNLFAPCIVIQEGSSFFKRSGAAASILHAVGLSCLFLSVIGGGINLCPDTSMNRHTPILHCFDGGFPNATSMQRSQFDNLSMSNCIQTFENFTSDDLQTCHNGILAVDFDWPWADKENKGKF